MSNPWSKTFTRDDLSEAYSLGWDDREETIVKMLEADRHESHALDDIFDGIVFQTISRAEFKQALIKLIKGGTNG